MKKSLLFGLITLMFGVYTIQAQGSKYGMRIGVNASSIDSDNLTGDLDENRYGLVVGFLAEYNLSDKWSLQPELQYSAQGNKEKNLRTNYLQLPIILKYNVTNTFNVHAGPQVGLKIWEWEDKLDAFDNSTFDFAGVVGVGVDVFENFFVDLRYALGLTNVFENDMPSLDIDGQSRNIQLSIGYKL
ncbi:porin family protein [Aquimarina rhabdastrellae]